MEKVASQAIRTQRPWILPCRRLDIFGDLSANLVWTVMCDGCKDVIQLRNIGGSLLQKKAVSFCECLQGSCASYSIEICVVRVKNYCEGQRLFGNGQRGYALGIEGLPSIAVVGNGWGREYRIWTKGTSRTSGRRIAQKLASPKKAVEHLPRLGPVYRAHPLAVTLVEVAAS